MRDRRRTLPAAQLERGGFADPAIETPRRAINRDQIDQGMVLEGIVTSRKVAQNSGVPRDNP